MLRHRSTALGILVLAISIFLLAQPISACTNHGEVTAASDYNLPVMSSLYDPCDYWLHWTYSFVRTANTENWTRVTFFVDGPNLDNSRTYDSRNFSPGPYSESGDEYVGPADGHRCKIGIVDGGSRGHFTGLKCQADYFNKPIENPGP